MKFLFFSLITFYSLSGWAIAEGDMRGGVIAGSFSHQGNLSTEGSALAYGAHYSYLFTDDFVFSTDLFINSTENLDHQNLSINLGYYYGHYRALYFNVITGLALITNSLNSNGESLSGTGVAVVTGAGVDMDLSKNFVAGFQLRYNIATATAEDSNSQGVGIQTLDSYVSVLTHIAYVF